MTTTPPARGDWHREKNSNVVMVTEDRGMQSWSVPLSLAVSLKPM